MSLACSACAIEAWATGDDYDATLLRNHRTDPIGFTVKFHVVDDEPPDEPPGWELYLIPPQSDT